MKVVPCRSSKNSEQTHQDAGGSEKKTTRDVCFFYTSASQVKEQLRSLVDANTKHITSLRFIGCNVDNELLKEICQAAVPPSVRELSVVQNCVSDLSPISSPPNMLNQLVSLNLNDNNLNDESVVKLASMLKHNKSLKQLRLAYNENLGLASFQALHDCLQSNTTLEYVDLYVANLWSTRAETLLVEIENLCNLNQAGRGLLRQMPNLAPYIFSQGKTQEPNMIYGLLKESPNLWKINDRNESTCLDYILN